MKKQTPVAVCTNCKAYTTNVTSINERCNKKYDGKRCQGVWGSAIAPNDWEECSTCHAAGKISESKCEHCDGYGWFYVRK